MVSIASDKVDLQLFFSLQPSSEKIIASRNILYQRIALLMEVNVTTTSVHSKRSSEESRFLLEINLNATALSTFIEKRDSLA